MRCGQPSLLCPEIRQLIAVPPQRRVRSACGGRPQPRPGGCPMLIEPSSCPGARWRHPPSTDAPGHLSAGPAWDRACRLTNRGAACASSQTYIRVHPIRAVDPLRTLSSRLFGGRFATRSGHARCKRNSEQIARWIDQTAHNGPSKPFIPWAGLGFFPAGHEKRHGIGRSWRVFASLCEGSTKTER